MYVQLCESIVGYSFYLEEYHKENVLLFGFFKKIQTIAVSGYFRI